MAPKGAERRARLAAWAAGTAVLLTVWLVSTAPLLLDHHRILFLDWHGDAPRTAWYQHFVLRAWEEGLPLDLAVDFDFPAPRHIRESFNSVADAWLAAPLNALFGWPGGWRASQVLAVLVNGLGVAWLAHAVGARARGVVTAGALAMVLQPIWRELLIGRPNTALPGLFAAALAAFLLTLDPGRRRWGMAALAGGLGALCAVLYPPWLPAFAVLAAVLVPREALKRPLVPALALLLGILLAGPELWSIAESRLAKVPEPPACLPSIQHTYALDLVALLGHPDRPPQVLLPAGLWMLASLSLLHPRHRGSGLGLLVVGVLLCLASLGPCPEWTYSPTTPLSGPRLLAPLVGLTPYLSDTSRLATTGAVGLIVAAGLGTDALGERSPDARAVGTMLGWLGLVHGAVLLRAEVFQPGHWLDTAPLPSSAFLRDAAPGAVAELPWDLQRQYISAIEAPGRPRVNPLMPDNPRPSDDPFVAWLGGLARGDLGQPAPQPVAATQVRWVVYDQARCATGNAPPEACSLEVIQALTKVLGPPVVLGPSVRAWSVTPVD